LSNKYRRIVRAIFGSPWAIMPEKLEQIVAFIELKAEGGNLSKDDIAAVMQARKNGNSVVSGSIAVLPLFGIISQRMDLMSEYSGGTSTELFSRDFKSALADPSVTGIIINIDSPGGTVYGVEELATEIYLARGKKPIMAIANSLAASAAAWIGMAAGKFLSTPGGEVGSIGVYSAHTDISKAEEMTGFKTTLISAGKFKVEGNPYQPLDEEAQSAIQSRVNEYYQMFTKSVARHRGVPISQVREGMGQGRVVGATEAMKLGMIDGIMTLDQAIMDMARNEGKKAQATSGLLHVENEDSIPKVEGVIVTTTGELPDSRYVRVTVSSLPDSFEIPIAPELLAVEQKVITDIERRRLELLSL